MYITISLLSDTTSNQITYKCNIIILKIKYKMDCDDNNLNIEKNYNKKALLLNNLVNNLLSYDDNGNSSSSNKELNDTIEKLKLIENIQTEINSSLPFSIKMLLPYYNKLEHLFTKTTNLTLKQQYAGILSLLSILLKSRNHELCLFYNFQTKPNQLATLKLWGYVYVQFLSAALIKHSHFLCDDSIDAIELFANICEYSIAKNYFIELCDFILSSDGNIINNTVLTTIFERSIDVDTYEPICLYLNLNLSYSNDFDMVLETIRRINIQFKDMVSTLLSSIQLNNPLLIESMIFTRKYTNDPRLLLQLAFITARYNIIINNEFSDDGSLNSLKSMVTSTEDAEMDENIEEYEEEIEVVDENEILVEEEIVVNVEEKTVVEEKENKEVVEEEQDYCYDDEEEFDEIGIPKYQNYNLENQLKIELIEISSNLLLSKLYLKSAEQMQLLEPLAPAHLFIFNCNNLTFSSISDTTATVSTEADHKNQILYSYEYLEIIFSNCLLNAGFNKNSVFPKYIDHNLSTDFDFNNLNGKLKLYAISSFGILNCWYHKNGLNVLSRYLYSDDNFIKAGAFIAVGLNFATTNAHNYFDHFIGYDEFNNNMPLLSVLQSQINSRQPNYVIISLCLCFGYTFIGTHNNPKYANIFENLLNIFNENERYNTMVYGSCALAFGFILIGEGYTNKFNRLKEVFIKYEKTFDKLNTIRFLLAFGLMFLQSECYVEHLLNDVPMEYKSMLETVLHIFMFTGSNNMIEIKKLLTICGKTSTNDDSKNQNFNLLHKQFAVVGIALIGMGGGRISIKMSVRLLQRIYKYCDELASVVPLAIALLYVSNPELNIILMLRGMISDSIKTKKRYSLYVTFSVIYALGLIGAGTKNCTIRNILNDIDAVTKYHKFLKNISLSLLYLGRGTITLDPNRNGDKDLHKCFSLIGLGGLISSVIQFIHNLDINCIEHNFLYLFDLTLTMYPRTLITINERMQSISVCVQIYKFKHSINNYNQKRSRCNVRICNTPVTLAYGELAELLDTNYVAVSPKMEGIVILMEK